MIRRFLSAAVCLCVLASCSLTKALKTGKHLSKAELSAAAYTSTFPFEMRTGHLQIAVNVNGTDCLFYLDTGAPTAVSPKLSRVLKMKPVTIDGRTDTLVTISKLVIDSLVYHDVGGLVINTGGLFKRSCTTVDGLVGANVMYKSIWQIDYINKRISVTSDIRNLVHTTDAVKIPFSTAPFTKSPLIQLTLDNGRTVNLVYDTGFNGYATINTDKPTEFLQSFQKDQITTALSSGYTSILGDSVAKKVDTSYIIQTNLLAGNNVLGNVPVTYGRYKNYSDEKNGVIGNEFFESSIVTLEWSTNTMYIFSPTPINKPYKTFGFSYGLVDNKMIVGSITAGSEAERQGIKVGDEVTEIDDLKIESLSIQQRCDFVDGKFVLIPDERTTSLFKFRKQSGEVVHATLTKH